MEASVFLTLSFLASLIFSSGMKWLKATFAFVFIFSQCARAHIAIDEMTDAAKALLNSLKPEQKEKAVFEIKSDERTNWFFVPKDRKGLPLKEMTKAQQDAVHGLLDSALSHQGYVKATTIMSLEKVLFEMENKSPKRDETLYYISIFGEPATNGIWGWRFEGHHLSLNFTLVDGKEVFGTPSFFGSNPGEVKQGPRVGTRVLGEEEDIGRRLVKAFDDSQLKKALISTNAPKEIITKNDRTVKPLEPVGLSFADMNKEQAELLIQLVKEYINRYRREISDDDWQKIKTAGLDNIAFAWAGELERGKPHYYRVQGPTFLLEYDNIQNDANHVHCVWRDFQNDFGEDVLKKHYEKEAHN